MRDLGDEGAPDPPDVATITRFLDKGLGNQIAMHVYDASPMFDFNLTGFLGEAIRGFGRGRGRIDSEVFPISFVVASLNSPVYATVPVQDAEVVDRFLDRLDGALAEKARRPVRGGWFNLDFDFYRMPLVEDHSIRCANIRFGPVKWRLFFARLGDVLCVASKPVFFASAIRLLSSPSRISALVLLPSRRRRLRIDTPSSSATNSRLQPHWASKAFSIAGPGPQSEAKEL